MRRFTPAKKRIFDPIARRKRDRATEVLDRIAKRLLDSAIRFEDDALASIDIGAAEQIVAKCVRLVYADWEVANNKAKATS